MKKSIKSVYNNTKVKIKDLSIEEANALFFGTTKPKIGQQVHQWKNAPNINEIIKKEQIDVNVQSLSDKFDIDLEKDKENTTLEKVEPKINMLKPPGYSSKVQVHPKDVPNLKLEKIYEFDTIQLIESLKFIKFEKQNLTKFTDFLAILRKKKDMKIYDFPEILNVIKFVRENLKQLSPSYQISFFYSLSKLQKFDDKKPSLDDQNLVFDVLMHITSNINKIDMRSMSNLAYALHTLQLNNPQVYNFDEFFGKLEERIIIKISKHIKNLSTQDISNIILAYCKTQNGSEEFYRILQEITIKMKPVLKPQDVAVILYSYANNPTCNEKLLEDFEELIKKNILIYKPKEICSLLRAYHMRKMLNEDLKPLFIESFIQKHEIVNSTDLAHFYSILAETNDPRFLKYAHMCISSLFFTFNTTDLAVILEKGKILQEKDPEVYKLLQKQVMKLIKKGDFKGFDLKKIYLSIKDLPFEGQYNLFVEKIESQLEKLKYF